MTTLRTYQREAIDALYSYFELKKGNPLVVIPTGGGKSHVIATFVYEVLSNWPGQRILILTHVRELIEQNHEKLLMHWPKAPCGVYSAGLGARDVMQPIIFAGIQSAFRRGPELGKFDLVLIDEAHLVPKKGEGMYRQLLEHMRKRNPFLKVIGFTATPYRLGSGRLDRGDGAIFTDIAYDVGVMRLVREGFLSPLVARQVGHDGEIDTAGVKKSGGEFAAWDLERAAMREGLVEDAVDEIVRLGAERRSWLLFGCGIDHARRIATALDARDVSNAVVVGDTPGPDRAAAIAAFKRGDTRALVSVGVLTTGFDAPQTDLIALLRPTQSAGLYVQMMGRGMRPAAGKTNCLVLDYGQNVRRHGPIDRIEPPEERKGTGDPQASPVKTCPACQTIQHLSARVCELCGHEFPAPSLQHDTEADFAQPLSGPNSPQWRKVDAVSYRQHVRVGAASSLRVDYQIGMLRVSEWVCIEHDGFARQRAVSWWKLRSGSPVPSKVNEALAVQAELRVPTHVQILRDGKYERVTGYRWAKADGEAEAGDARAARGAAASSA